MTEPMVTVAALFAAVGLSPSQSVEWGHPYPEQRPGIYVIEIDGRIVYIGRTKRALSKRIREFYRHKYGDTRPHRGGQELLIMPGTPFVYWCACDDPRDAETRMLHAYERACGRIPAANRRRGDGVTP